MTQRGLRESLEDILDAISEINYFVRDVTFEDFLSNREKVLAVVKLLEIIGEATKKIPLNYATNILKFLGRLWQGCAIF